jgi:hypothetical protein
LGGPLALSLLFVIAADNHVGGEAKPGDAPAAAPADAAPADAEASAEDGTDDDLPIPKVYSFRTRDTFDGKVGLGLMHMSAQPFGASTGYGQLFWQGDYDGIGGSGFGIHWDFDLRVQLFEQRDPTYINKQGDAVGVNENGNPQGNDGVCENGNNYDVNVVDPCLGPNNNTPLTNAELTRQPFNFFTGRAYDYLRLDKLYLTFDTDFFGVGLGRMLVQPAAQASIDGFDAWFGLGNFGRAGVFGGLKPNPWHQQVVGAISGGALSDGAGGLFSPLWGDVVIDPFAYRNTGAYANEIGPFHDDPDLDSNLPWLHLGSARFISLGGYGSLRLEGFSADTALVFDLFDVVGAQDPDLSGVDRVWSHVNGGWRIFGPLTLAFRGTIDWLGARPLTPRDLFLDLTWRELGPLTIGASYYKINTYATALSYATFFRALEDPDGSVANPADPNNPWVIAANENPALAATYQSDAAFAAGIAGTRLNNTRLFVVDRDRFAIDAALAIGGTFQLYTELLAERRGDSLYTANAPIDTAVDGITNGLDTLLAGPCFTAPDDPAKPVGITSDVPVHDDLCKFGGTLGLRDPFLANVGFFDLALTYLDGYFQSTRRLRARVGTSLKDTIWVEAGGAIEENNNHRVFASFAPPLADGVPFYTARKTNAYLLDAAVAWRVFAGLMVEASYFGFLEDVPFQGDTLIWPERTTPMRRDGTQFMQTFFVRTLYRF